MAIRSAWPIYLALTCAVPFFIALVVSLVTAYVVSRRLGSVPAGGASRALEILKERYARGELTLEQYEEMRRTLEQ